MILITGMHRSGTSLVAQILYDLGLDFGDPNEFIKKDRWNINGYYENTNIVNINNNIILGKPIINHYIEKYPSTFYSRLATNLFSYKWKYLTFPNQNKLESNYRKIYAKKDLDLTKNTKDLTFKDPRFCLTIKFWQRLYNVEYVFFSFRNPWSNASSLYKRDGLPTFIGLKLWEYHVRTFFDNVKEGTKIKLINFDNFNQESTYHLEINKVLNSCKFFNIKNKIIDNKVFNKNLVHNHFIEKIVKKKNFYKIYENLSNLSQENSSFIDYDYKIKNKILS